jgi:hypothetical protein
MSTALPPGAGRRFPPEAGAIFFRASLLKQMVPPARLGPSSAPEERMSSAVGPRIHCAPAPERPPSLRVLRGGSWNNNPQNLRSANRNRNQPDNRNNNIGFRVASTLYAGADGITVPPGEQKSVQGRS